MSKNLTIIDKDYTHWVEELSVRYRQSQIKAAVKVNREMLKYYWELGRDIEEMHVEERWGEGVIKNLSADLQHRNPNSTGLSRTNIYYAKKFYQLYSQYFKVVPQAVGQNHEAIPQAVGQLEEMLFSIPWGHHRYLMDKYGSEPTKALFYVRKTMEEGWSRDVLLNFMDTGLYEREGKGITNFMQTLPAPESDLAQEITRDPYCFGFTETRDPYNERVLKDALIHNIERFLLELGTGFAYMGREYRLQVGQTEQFLDMLFYNVRLRCYVVIEVKTTKFQSSHIGQLGAYMVAVDHQLCKAGDNKTIGLLICKSKDRVEAQYALEASTQPISVSEYDLEKFYPEKLEGTIPTVEEIEANLAHRLEDENSND